MHTSINNRRFQKVVFAFLGLFTLCLSRLWYIQFYKSSYLANIASQQHNLYVELESLRGSIYDRNMRPLAFNLPSDSLYASARQVKEKDKVVSSLSDILGLDAGFLQERLYRDKAFVWIARKLSPDKAVQIKKLNIKGLDFIRESKRIYPNNELAAHNIGFAGLDNTGLEGVELCYDEYLKGANGWAQVLRDSRQNKLLWENIILPKDGNDVILTIDEFIQFVTERELDKVYKSFKAKGASIVVLNPRTGEILAMANRPTYDLNQAHKSGPDSRRNRAICDMFEPGSVFKVITASAALEERRFKESDRFFCENGSYKVANHILHDHKPHGWLTFSYVFANSSNIGTVKIAQGLGADTVYNYAKAFGFGNALGIDIQGEINGILKEPKTWSKTSISAVPMGHEVGVSALQLASAISVIANGGLLMRPFIVKAIQEPAGEKIKEFSPRVIRRVISKETAKRITEILVLATEEGTGKMARVEDIDVAGKTGTAQKIEPAGGYSHNKFIASFIGFAPADDPMIAVVVTVDEPRPYYFGGVVAAPVFKAIAQDVIKYLRLKDNPDETVAIVKKN